MTLRLLIIAGMMMLLPLGSHAAEEPKAVKSAVAGYIAAAKAHKAEGVYLLFEQSPEMTAVIRSRLADTGWKMVDDPLAPVQVRVSIQYAGPAKDRPVVGSEGQDRPEIAISDIVGALISAVALIKHSDIALHGPSPSERRLAVGFTGGEAMGTLAPLKKAGFFKRTKAAQEAYLVKVSVEVKGEATQYGQVLTESFAEEVPMELLIQDNLEQLIWFID